MQLTEEQAHRTRDAIVKRLYTKIHALIVKKINETVTGQYSVNGEHFIDILDMPGFGKFQKRFSFSKINPWINFNGFAHFFFKNALNKIPWSN